MIAVVTCPLCQNPADPYASAKDLEYCTSGRRFDFYRCKACDVLFINPMLVDSLQEIYPANYYSFKEGDKSFAQALKQKLDEIHFRKILRTVPGECLSALDIGGGTGWLLNTIRSIDPRIAKTTVVDIDASALQAARDRGHRTFLGRIEDYETNERFDVILMLNLIEHVAEPAVMLQKARNLLSERGRLLIKTPNFDALDARLFRHRNWGGYHTPRHFVLFTRESLCEVCKQSGLTVERFSYTQGAPFWSLSILYLLQRIGLVRISRERPAIYHPLMPLLQIIFAGFDFLRRPFGKLSQMQFVLKRDGSDRP